MMDWEDWVWCIVLILVVVAVLVGITVGITYLTMPPTCEAMTENIGLPHQWSFWGGCQVQEDGKWIPLENWRYFGND